MNATDLLNVVRRRWYIVVGLAVLGAVAAFLVGPPEERAPDVEYVAETTLVPGPEGPTASRLGLLIQGDDVAGVIADEYGYPTKFELLEVVTITPNIELELVQIATRQPTEEQAVGVADGLASTVIANLEADQAESRAAEVAALEEELAGLRAELGVLGPRVENGSASITEQADYTALLTTYSNKLAEARDLGGAAEAPAEIISSATPRELLTGGSSTPLSRPLLAVIGAFVGLLLGVGVVVALDRLDSKIRSTADAVEVFDLPVIGQVPSAPREFRGSQDVLTHEKPKTSISESYRSLRTRISATEGAKALGSARGGVPARGGVYLVTSAGVADGKSTTVANLAAAFADAGRSVIVVSADLRSPSIHRFLDVADDAPGLGDGLEIDDTGSLEDILQPTSLPHVRLLSHGHLVNNTGELLAANRFVMRLAAEVADVVLIDSPPILAGNDVAEMLPVADGVLVVTRIGRTQRPIAESSRELLESLDAPVLGLVVLESPVDSAIRGYYGPKADAAGLRSQARVPQRRAAEDALVVAAPVEPDASAVNGTHPVDAAEPPPVEHERETEPVGGDLEPEGRDPEPSMTSWSAWRTR